MPPYMEQLESEANPLDNVEEVLLAHNWVFNRMSDHELMVQVHGKTCEYRLFFIWQDDMSALQFCCQYDLTVSDENMSLAARTLMTLNENLWMGHFDLPGDTGIPSFRHTCLLRGMSDEMSGAEYIEDLVDISLAQCERYLPAFHLLSMQKPLDDQTMSLALMHGAGEA